MREIRLSLKCFERIEENSCKYSRRTYPSIQVFSEYYFSRCLSLVWYASFFNLTCVLWYFFRTLKEDRLSSIGTSHTFNFFKSQYFTFDFILNLTLEALTRHTILLQRSHFLNISTIALLFFESLVCKCAKIVEMISIFSVVTFLW